MMKAAYNMGLGDGHVVAWREYVIRPSKAHRSGRYIRQPQASGKTPTSGLTDESQPNRPVM
jgi:hypothetical protein